MGRPVLWGGFEIGASREELRRSFAHASEQDGSLVFTLEMLDCEFEVTASFDETGLSKVTLNLARTLASQRFVDVRQRLTDAICVKHGKGQARQVVGDIFRKRWREPWVEIDFVAVDDPNFPTMSVCFRKIAIADAALRYL